MDAGGGVGVCSKVVCKVTKGRGVVGCEGAGGCYLSVQRGGVRESGWEGRRQLGGVERVRGPHVRAARVEGRDCELICGEKETEEGETEKRRKRMTKRKR